METLIIDRRGWLRAEGFANSRLLRAFDGKKCCLGFYCLQRGFEASDLKGMSVPSSLLRANPEVLPRLSGLVNDDEHTDVCVQMMLINDNRWITDSERERQLTDKFREIGIEVKF